MLCYANAIGLDVISAFRVLFLLLFALFSVLLLSKRSCLCKPFIENSVKNAEKYLLNGKYF